MSDLGILGPLELQSNELLLRLMRQLNVSIVVKHFKFLNEMGRIFNKQTLCGLFF